MNALHAIAYTAIAIALLTSGGNWACRQVFALTGLMDAKTGASDSNLPAGRIIGCLERVILAVGIIAHSWEILAAVIALKTVARFKELDEQISAEYFLVGSLFSLLWAILVTTAWLGYDQHIGTAIQQQVASTLQAQSSPRGQ